MSKSYAFVEGQYTPDFKSLCSVAILFEDNVELFQPEPLNNIIRRLWKLYRSGITLVFFGGVGSLLRILWGSVAAETSSGSKHLNRIGVIALECIDICVDHACDIGWYVSLNSFAKGCSIDVPGDSCQERVWVIYELFKKRVDTGMVYSYSRSGKRRLWIPRAPTFRKMSECIHQFEQSPPDVSWMTQPTDVSTNWDWIQ